MLDLARNGYTEQEVINQLHGKNGSRGPVKIRYDLLNRQDVKLGELMVQSGRVAMDSLAEIKRTASFELTEQEAQDVDWLNDRIRPVFCLKMPEIRKTYKAWGKIDASFSRSSIAYLSDGTQVAANQPRFEQGKFGKAVMVEEGTENLLPKIQDWRNYTNRQFEIISDYEVKILPGDYHYFIYYIPVTEGNIYTLSGKYVTGTGQIYYYWCDTNKKRISTKHIAPCTEEAITGAAYAEVILHNLNDENDVILKDWQLEQKPYSTSFIDGTRAAETLTIPTAGVWNKGGWEQTFSFKPTSTQAVAGKTGYLWDLCIDADNYYALKVGSDGKPYLEVKSNGTTYQTATTNAPAMSTGTWYTLSIRGNGSQMALFVNGSKVSEVSYTEPLGDLPQYMYLGSDHNGANHANGLYDDLRISSRARSDAEILAAYQSGQPAPVDEWTTAKFDFDNRLTGEYFTIVNDSKPVQWIEWPLGVFLLSSPTRKNENRQVKRSIEAYDSSLILKEDKFTDRYTIAAGTKYTDAVIDILNGAGIWKINIIDHPGTLATDREFEIGTEKLFAINELLAAINYTSLWVDENGYFVAQPYVLPSSRDPEYEYRTNDLSVIHPGSTEELDLFAVPNKFVRYVSNPDRAVILRSEYTNDLSTSPTSTINRGRTIVDIDHVEDIYDQATLDEYVKRIAYNTSQVYGKFEFATALMPHHSYYNCLFVEYDPLGISHKYMESSWTMDLHANGVMRHSCRRVVQI